MLSHAKRTYWGRVPGVERWNFVMTRLRSGFLREPLIYSSSMQWVQEWQRCCARENPWVTNQARPEWGAGWVGETETRRKRYPTAVPMEDKKGRVEEEVGRGGHNPFSSLYKCVRSPEGMIIRVPLTAKGCDLYSRAEI